VQITPTAPDYLYSTTHQAPRGEQFKTQISKFKTTTYILNHESRITNKELGIHKSIVIPLSDEIAKKYTIFQRYHPPYSRQRRDTVGIHCFIANLLLVFLLNT